MCDEMLRVQPRALNRALLEIGGGRLQDFEYGHDAVDASLREARPERRAGGGDVQPRVAQRAASTYAPNSRPGGFTIRQANAESLSRCSRSECCNAEIISLKSPSITRSR